MRQVRRFQVLVFGVLAKVKMRLHLLTRGPGRAQSRLGVSLLLIIADFYNTLRRARVMKLLLVASLLVGLAGADDILRDDSVRVLTKRAEDNKFRADFCGYPGSPAHASIAFTTEAIETGTIATYTCDNGYELLGPPRRTCAENGTWVPQGIPFCGESAIMIITRLSRLNLNHFSRAVRCGGHCVHASEARNARI